MTERKIKGEFLTRRTVNIESILQKVWMCSIDMLWLWLAKNLGNKLEACVGNVGRGLTRRDGAEDIAEHISAAAVNDTDVLGEEGVRSQKQVPCT